MGIREEKNWPEIERRLWAVRVVEEGGGSPEVRRAVARACGVTERSVRRWEQRVREGKPVYDPPGRKPDEPPRAVRQQVLRELERLGPMAGVPTLRGLFPDVPYRFLAKMKQRYTRVLVRRRGWRLKKLHWKHAGSVWACDFTQPKAGLWGGAKKLFVVRDLGSQAQLAAVACRGETAQSACVVLLALFLTFGAPLVLKHDQGSAFMAHETRALLAEHDTVPLASPARTPEYNGSCERAGGCLKVRIAHEASRHGRQDHWVPADVGAALWLANTTARPFGATGPTPAEAFDAREAITDAEREAFQQTRTRAFDRRVQQWSEETGRMPTCSQRARLERLASSEALCELGYLAIRRGRLSTPLSVWKADRKA